MIARAIAAVVLAVLVAAPAAVAAPVWFEDATAVIAERGGTCTPFAEAWSPHPAELRRAVGESCTHALPLALGRLFDPRRERAPSEACWGQAIEVARRTTQTDFLCAVQANPGTEAHPNGASWRCERITNASGWTADAGLLYAPASFPTLERCLAPRVILQTARRRSALSATCSHACTVRVLVTPRGSGRELGRLRRALGFGAPTELPLLLDRPLPQRMTLHVRVAAGGGLMRTATIAATLSAGRLSLPRTTILFGG